MIIYNVTVKLEPRIADQWLAWLKEEHIPDMKSTGCFYDAAVYHLHDTDENDGITYAVQYHAKNMEDYNRYFSDFSNEMRKKGTDKWNNQFVSFRSVLELVH